MSKFVAANAVEAMEYDFTAYGGRKGIIPEPTTGQVQDFFNTIKEVTKEVRRLEFKANQLEKAHDDDVSDEEAIDNLTSMADDMSQRFSTQLVDALANLCSKEPSSEEITALPHRVLAAFSAWVADQIRPQQPTATKR